MMIILISVNDCLKVISGFKGPNNLLSSINNKHNQYIAIQRLSLSFKDTSQILEHVEVCLAPMNVGHDLPQALNVDVHVYVEVLLVPPVLAIGVWCVTAHLGYGATPVPVHNLQSCLDITIVITVKHLLPGRGQLLDVGLGVKVTREDEELVRMLPGEVGKPDASFI